MRQRDYAIGKSRARSARKMRSLLLCITADVGEILLLPAWKQASAARADVFKLRLRSRAISAATFNINVFSTEDSLREFRFQVSDIARVAAAMDWTAGITKRNGYHCDPITGCCIVLRRLAYPSRWKDLEHMFGMHASALSEVFWEIIECFVESRGHLLSDLRESLLVSRAPLYAECIKDAGSPLESCVGFIDCTKIKMTRPGGHGSMQRSCYSGHKRMHCLIYQTVTTPDGLMFSLYGPEVGRRHDTTLLRQSGLGEKLQSCLLINGRHFYIYGDAAYMLMPWLQVAFDRLGATPAEEVYNTKMSAVRVTVEWNYKDLKQMWSTNDFARALKVRKAPIALMYIASGLLLNFKTCIEQGGQVGSFFKCAPPTLSEYLNSE